MSKELTPARALIFRITHRANLRWILQNGLHCANSKIKDPNFHPIGNAELIRKRTHRVLPVQFGGHLSDYIPFYFTPFSPMMYNIHTGHNGITKQRNEDIVILVSSIWKLMENDVTFVFSDRHAYLEAAEFSDSPDDLDKIDWAILQARDFKYDPDDLAKMERYQAEALIRRYLPIKALMGVACFNESALAVVESDMHAAGANIRATIKSRWYF